MVYMFGGVLSALGSSDPRDFAKSRGSRTFAVAGFEGVPRQEVFEAGGGAVSK
jgi:hypothetical protein